MADFEVDKMWLSKKQGTIKAFATVKVSDLVFIRNLKVMSGKKGNFVSLPNFRSKDKDGKVKYNDIVIPASKEANKKLQEAVLKAYEEKSRS